MFTIKFNAIDIDSKIVYCFYRDTSENKKSSGIERISSYDIFTEKEQRLKNMLEGDICSIYLQDDYTEKKSIDGTLESLSEEEITYIRDLVMRACYSLEFDDLLKPPSIDDQIDNFIKEFFDEKNDSNSQKDDSNNQKDFLAQFFQEIDDKK
jgi:hypothetical protein